LFCSEAPPSPNPSLRGRGVRKSIEERQREARMETNKKKIKKRRELTWIYRMDMDKS